MSGISYTMPRFQAIDQNGRPMVGATLYTYKNKTTTPHPTWKDREQTAYNTNPIVLDARGEAVIWLDLEQVYTFVLRDWFGALVWSQDDVAGGASQIDLAAPEGAQMVGFLQAGDGAVSRTMLDKAREVVSVKDFGAVGDGVTDDSAAIQKAVNAAPVVYFPPGNYICDSTILIPGGTTLSGAGGYVWNTPADRRTRVASRNAGTILFDVDVAASPYSCSGIEIRGFHLVSDYPIRMNDPEETVLDGTQFPPYVMNPRIFGNFFRPVTTYGGTAITLSKCFDGLIQQNNIEQFSIGIHLNGCDINLIQNNRINNYDLYGILETSADTFGSQNLISHNDILCSRANTIGIKSSSRYVWIKDNFLELLGVKGHIDISSIDMPTFGSNIQATRPYNVVIEDNRLAGKATCEFGYRITTNGETLKLRDPASSEAPSPGYLTFVGKGAGLLPLTSGAAGAVIDYDINVPGVFTLQSKPIRRFFKSIIMDRENVTRLNRSLIDDDYAADHVFISADSIVIKPTLPSLLRLCPDTVTGVRNTTDNANYRVTVTARAENPGETLRAFCGRGSRNTNTVNLTLEDAFRTYEIVASADGTAPGETFRVYLLRTTSPSPVGDIYVQSVQIEELV